MHLPVCTPALRHLDASWSSQCSSESYLQDNPLCVDIDLSIFDYCYVMLYDHVNNNSRVVDHRVSRSCDCHVPFNYAFNVLLQVYSKYIIDIVVGATSWWLA
jgi:hypothetical protein